MQDQYDMWILVNFARLPLDIRKKEHVFYKTQISSLNRELFDCLCGMKEWPEHLLKYKEGLEKLSKPPKNPKRVKYAKRFGRGKN